MEGRDGRSRFAWVKATRSRMRARGRAGVRDKGDGGRGRNVEEMGVGRRGVMG